MPLTRLTLNNGSLHTADGHAHSDDGGGPVAHAVLGVAGGSSGVTPIPGIPDVLAVRALPVAPTRVEFAEGVMPPLYLKSDVNVLDPALHEIATIEMTVNADAKSGWLVAHVVDKVTGIAMYAASGLLLP